MDAVRRLTPKQKLRLLAELQDEAFGLDLAGLKIDTGLSGVDLNIELPDFDLQMPELEQPEVCPFCGKGNQG